MLRAVFASLVWAFINSCSTINPANDLTTNFAPKLADNVLHHNIQISVEPATHQMSAITELTIPAAIAKDGVQFLVNSDLRVEKISGSAHIKQVGKNQNADDLGMDRDNDHNQNQVRVNVYQLSGLKPGQDNTITLGLVGKINHPVQQLGEQYSRGFSSSPGLIEPRGVYLSGASYWLPTIENTLLTYQLDVDLPKGWSSVSQGQRQKNTTIDNRHHDRWHVPTPTEEVYLIGAEFVQYQMPAGAITAMAYLRTKDDALANKYLTTTAQYLEMYRQLVGPYPYHKFALVENFWETGYGMPSFTLLGSQVIRFPFILHSSYPHELLHNWWGNSVYIDFDSGNWAEGLTAYMADHLVAEQRGQGAMHRRANLQRYTNYVDASTDFALAGFVGRTDAATQAVGYGKTSMVFNMLREKVGDENFKRSLQKFYRDHKFQIGRWDDIKHAFEAVTEQDLGGFFHQWVDGIGAPALRLEKAAQQGDHLTLILQQTQDGEPYSVQVPVVVYSADTVKRHTVSMNQNNQVFELAVTGKVIQVAIDPEFDLFRRLHWAEIPPSLGNAFGAKQVLMILPNAGDVDQQSWYQQLAKIWATRDNFSVITDNQLDALPTDVAVWVLGRQNKFYPLVAQALPKYNASISTSEAKLGDKTLPLAENSTIIVTRNPNNPQMVVVGLTIHSKTAISGLARKLPHYGKYSYLAFTDNAPTNSAKGQWPAVNSPLVAIIDKTKTTAARLEPRPALAELKPVFDAKRLQGVVETLSSQPYQGRGVGTQGLDKAAQFIRQQFIAANLKPAGDQGSYFQQFEMIGPDDKPVLVKNVVAIIPGTNPKFAGQSVIVSAHYDHLGFGWPDVRAGFGGQIHPGADDNASGIAVLLELAHALAKSAPQRSIILLASTAEEAGLRGARHYLSADKSHPSDKIFANVNLDTVGRATDKFLIFGSGSAREWPFIFMGAAATTGIQSQLVKQALGASDHQAFLEAGIVAVHIFGAATSDYHRPTDSADKIDIASLLKATTLSKEVVQYLSNRDGPMTNLLKPADPNTTKPTTATQTGRTVSTGTMPDFAFAGTGVKIAQIAPNSAGDTAGLKPGDILTQFGGVIVTNLRSYTQQLSKYNPGDTVQVIVERNGKPMVFELELAKR